MQIPQIQIRQQYAKIGIDADMGKQSIEQPKATLEIKQNQAVQSISQPKGQLDINQDRAWDALGLGNSLETMSKIYSMASDMALQGLARIVEKGNRMADIHLGGNPIAEMALDWQRTFPEFDFRGEASTDNVDVNYTPGQLSIETTPGRVEIHAQINRPIIQYERGKLDIYMQQHPSLQITPPQINELI
ncbi:DUF6470 family protein [Paenibacillus sp. sgz302251]|uniref:DUF6470 family protein n=1 Tax=Paenibacillus sp. sgz302251 TaxID=3414493 RepID=UPI003C79A57C